MLLFLRKLLRVPPAKVVVNTISSTHVVEKMLADYAPFVARTETSMEDTTSGQELEPLLFLLSDGEKPKPTSTLQVSNKREGDSMKANGSSDWQDHVDWEKKVEEPDDDWGVEW